MFSQKSFMEGCVNYVTDFPGEQDVSFNYDGLGKRRNKLVDGDATWWRWAGWSIVSEYDGGAVQTDWDPGTRELGYIPGLAQFTHNSGAGTYDYNFFLQDHLGSTRNVLSETKALLANLEYTPYGEELQFGGKLPSPRFTGHHWDAETGMYFAPFRYYMPGAGRWLSRDPLGMVDGPNVYGYVGGEPLAHIDPMGLDLIDLCVLGKWSPTEDERQAGFAALWNGLFNEREPEESFWDCWSRCMSESSIPGLGLGIDSVPALVGGTRNALHNGATYKALLNAETTLLQECGTVTFFGNLEEALSSIDLRKAAARTAKGFAQGLLVSGVFDAARAGACGVKCRK